MEAWFAHKGWQPFAFQREAWEAYSVGHSGLIHASTGTGKTLAAWLGPVVEGLMEEQPREQGSRGAGEKRLSPKRRRSLAPPLRVLWITPLRALAGDTELSLREPVEQLGLNWTVERRTGDTSSALRARQKERLPTALVTTPESLSLLLSWPGARERFADLRCVIVDEWHELLSSKRGTQVELALARLRRWRPELRTWGLSATLGNLDVAMAALVGSGVWGVGSEQFVGPLPTAHSPLLVRGESPKDIVIDSLIPEKIERFPWAGHLGLTMLPHVTQAISESNAERAGSALVFTNTRSQTETWYQAILDAKPEWAGEIALHHGSLDRERRDFVERGLKEGQLRAVVCTSSLDLGVDFSPVDRVLQIGTPKGVARLIQRAGRSGHSPGRPSRVTCVPTNALELIEVAAARDAVAQGKIESRPPAEKPLDVLAQHAVTIAVGGGFDSDELLAEIRTAYAYRNLSDEEWQWVIEFVTRGGRTLGAYPEFKRVIKGADGVYRAASQDVARRHRLSIGTIVSEAAINVQYLTGGRLGTVEESFVSWLRPGECFLFAGKLLEFVRLHDNTAWVRRAPKKRPAVPRWTGARMPFSTELSRALRDKLQEAREGKFIGPEMKAVRPILELQMQRSILPAPDELLIERAMTREGHHLFVFPFDGRAVHEGMAALMAYRLSRSQPISFSFAINDYGFELLSADAVEPYRGDAKKAEDESLLSISSRLRDVFSANDLADDLVASLNAAALAKRQFREIARIAGLITEGLPHQRKSAKQLQASSGLFYEVFSKYDPDNLLLVQANREVLEKQLENSRLARALQRVVDGRITVVDVPRPTPLAFPLMVDRLREQLSSESLADRVRKMQAQFDM